MFRSWWAWENLLLLKMGLNWSGAFGRSVRWVTILNMWQSLACLLLSARAGMQLWTYNCSWSIVQILRHTRRANLCTFSSESTSATRSSQDLQQGRGPKQLSNNQDEDRWMTCTEWEGWQSQHVYKNWQYKRSTSFLILLHRLDT